MAIDTWQAYRQRLTDRHDALVEAVNGAEESVPAEQVSEWLEEIACIEGMLVATIQCNSASEPFADLE
jgi:hypothetical protein